MNVILFYNDIQKYPPIISVINTLLSNHESVTILGYCSNSKTIKALEEKGAIYREVIIDDTRANPIIKVFKLLNYRRRVKSFLETQTNKDNLTVWVFGERNGWLLHSLFSKYKVILYLFEMVSFSVLFRFRLLSPFLNYNTLMKSVWKVVCCEYNRALIVKSFFNLTVPPVVIPNKPVVKLENIPDLEQVNRELYNLFSTKKIILYQGIFDYPERRLDELCEAVDFLPCEFHIVLLGESNSYKEKLQRKYTSARIHFISYVPFPMNLSLTKLSYIGFLSYYSRKGDITNTLNTLYCAPNKIYEYALFNKPSISNELPAMRNIYSKFKIGENIHFTPKNIAETIIKIDRNYKDYKGFKSFLDETNSAIKIMSLLKDSE